MTKSDAIDSVKFNSFVAVHRQSDSSISMTSKIISHCPLKESRDLEFNGPCPNDDNWNIEYLGSY